MRVPKSEGGGWMKNKAQDFDFRDIALPVHYLLSIIDCIVEGLLTRVTCLSLMMGLFGQN